MKNFLNILKALTKSPNDTIKRHAKGLLGAIAQQRLETLIDWIDTRTKRK